MKRKKEFFDVIDQQGNLTGEVACRAKAHEKGILHRGVSVIVFDTNGDILLEKRAPHKDLFPNLLDVPGGHVPLGANYLATATIELEEEIGIKVDNKRLTQITEEGGLFEYLNQPEKGRLNREKKTIYVYCLDQEEENLIKEKNQIICEKTPEELVEMGPTGEVSALLFCDFSLFLRDFRENECNYASGTRTIFRSYVLTEKVRNIRKQITENKRQAVLAKISEKINIDIDSKALDEKFINIFLPFPDDRSDENMVYRIFRNGKDTLAGSYNVGKFRFATKADKFWQDKLNDTFIRYVKNELIAIAYMIVIDKGIKNELVDDFVDEFLKKEELLKNAREFVKDILYFHLSNGKIFRDTLSNLQESEVSRTALRLFLLNIDGIEEKLKKNPLYKFNEISNKIIREILVNEKKGGNTDHDLSYDHIKRRILQGITANFIDYNNPNMQGLRQQLFEVSNFIKNFFKENQLKKNFDALGGERFLEEFYSHYLASGKEYVLAFLTDNNGQGVVSLKCAEEFLLINPNLKVFFIPKNGHHSNDLSCDDVKQILEEDKKVPEENQIFISLRKIMSEGRFMLIEDGPEIQGIDPSRLSYSTAKALDMADVILAEGQAYAEIRGWNKPVYVAFQVKGRIAQAIHGIDKDDKAAAFVLLKPGIDHFSCIEEVVNRRFISKGLTTSFSVAAQTTKEYVSAITSDNYHCIINDIFNFNEAEAIDIINIEAKRLKRTFARVILGLFNNTNIEYYSEKNKKTIPPLVFACGGGGGFNQVTLKALRALDIKTVAGVPSTDNGGSSGKIQQALKEGNVNIYGVGDGAAILTDALHYKGKQPILSYRPKENISSLLKAVFKMFNNEIVNPTYIDFDIKDSPDFISFICEQLNLARIIDNEFLSSGKYPNFSIKGSSIRNLNIIAAYQYTNTFKGGKISEERAKLGLQMLEEAVGLDEESKRTAHFVPVTYDEATLYATYKDPIPESEIERLSIPAIALCDKNSTVIGQKFIDQIIHDSKIIDFGVLKSINERNGKLPRCSKEYIENLKSAKLFIMGAGSLYGSQLAQLAIPGVIDILIQRNDMRKIFVINHVNLNETNSYTLTDHVHAVERLANKVIAEKTKKLLNGEAKIGDIFTDIVVPKTIAKEIENIIDEGLEKGILNKYGDPIGTKYTNSNPLLSQNGDLIFINFDWKIVKDKQEGILLNRYVYFLMKYPEFRKRNRVTTLEIEVLSFLDQPHKLYSSRSEAGRYRGAIFARETDIEYIVDGGIPRRNIHEVACISQNQKLLKAEGHPTIEKFPGLTPEVLSGIFKILLEDAVYSQYKSC